MQSRRHTRNLDNNASPSTPCKALEKKLFLARTTLFAEKLYPAAFPAMTLVLLYMSIALLGILDMLPLLLRLLLLSALALVVIRSIGHITHIVRPSKQQAAARLDADNAEGSPSMRFLLDRPADLRFLRDFRLALWQKQRSRCLEALKTQHPHPPKSTIDRVDPLRLRLAAFLLFFIAAFAAGPQAGGRLYNAFVPPQQKLLPVPLQITMHPPDYTGLAPFSPITGQNTNLTPGKPLEILEGTRMHFSLPPAHEGNFHMLLYADGERKKITLNPQQGKKEASTIITQGGTYVFYSTRFSYSLPVMLRHDIAPEMTLLHAPVTTPEGKTRLAFAFEDDFPIKEARLVLRLRPQSFLSGFFTDADIAATTSRLNLPAASGSTWEGEIELDLREHKWAGLSTDLRIEVEDAKNQIARVYVDDYRLPRSDFTQPDALRMLDTVMLLGAAPSQKTHAELLLRSVLVDADKRFADPLPFLEAKTFALTLQQPGIRLYGDATLHALWEIAAYLEKGALSSAWQQIKSLISQLQETLRNNPDDPKVDRLWESLRQAINRYLQEKAKNPDNLEQEPQSDENVLDGQQFSSIFDELEQLSQEKSAQTASMLDDFLKALENMQVTNGRNGKGQGGNPQLSPYGELIGKQRDLREQTQACRDPSCLQEMQQRQNETTRALQELKNRQQQSNNGQRPGNAEPNGTPSPQENGTIPGLDALNKALLASETAQNALRRGESGKALAQQEQVIEQLRESAMMLAEEINRNRGESDPLNSSPFPSIIGRDLLGDWEATYDQRTIVERIRALLRSPALLPEERAYLERLLSRY